MCRIGGPAESLVGERLRGAVGHRGDNGLMSDDVGGLSVRQGPRKRAGDVRVADFTLLVRVEGGPPRCGSLPMMRPTRLPSTRQVPGEWLCRCRFHRQLGMYADPMVLCYRRGRLGLRRQHEPGPVRVIRREGVGPRRPARRGRRRGSG